MNDRVIFETEDASELMGSFIQARMTGDDNTTNWNVRYLAEWLDDAEVPDYVRVPIVETIQAAVWKGWTDAMIAEQVLLFSNAVALLHSRQ